jgi:hypothetical protein
MLEFVKFLGNSYLLQINPFHFLNFCNINVYPLVDLSWHEKHNRIILALNLILNT